MRGQSASRGIADRALVGPHLPAAFRTSGVACDLNINSSEHRRALSAHRAHVTQAGTQVRTCDQKHARKPPGISRFSLSVHQHGFTKNTYLESASQNQIQGCSCRGS